MSHDKLQILFLGNSWVWLKVAQAALEAPGASIQLHPATSLRDGMHCLATEKWDAVFLDLSYPPAKELLLALQLHSVFHAIPAVALLALSDPKLEGEALSAGAATCLGLENITAEDIHAAAIAAISGGKSANSFRKATQMQFVRNSAERELFSGGKIESVSHALKNLLCVINANADILADQVSSSQPAVRSVDQIKKAAKTAAELVRHLKTS
jgi:DNA-binding NarL/FixJ family response regulator